MPRGKRTVEQRVKQIDGETVTITTIKVELDDTPLVRKSRYLVDPEDAPENKPSAPDAPAKQSTPVTPAAPVESKPARSAEPKP